MLYTTNHPSPPGSMPLRGAGALTPERTPPMWPFPPRRRRPVRRAATTFRPALSRLEDRTLPAAGAVVDTSLSAAPFVNFTNGSSPGGVAVDRKGDIIVSRSDPAGSLLEQYDAQADRLAFLRFTGETASAQLVEPTIPPGFANPVDAEGGFGVFPDGTLFYYDFGGSTAQPITGNLKSGAGGPPPDVSHVYDVQTGQYTTQFAGQINPSATATTYGDAAGYVIYALRNGQTVPSVVRTFVTGLSNGVAFVERVDVDALAFATQHQIRYTAAVIVASSAALPAGDTAPPGI